MHYCSGKSADFELVLLFLHFVHIGLPEQYAGLEGAHPEQGAGEQEELLEQEQLVSEDLEHTGVRPA